MVFSQLRFARVGNVICQFYDFVVWRERNRTEKRRYMHRHPVQRGLVLEPDQWAWRSFGYYAYREAGPVVVKEPRTPRKRTREITGRDKMAG